MLQFLQKLGKSLQFPIVVLPIAAILLRIGSLMADPTINAELAQGGNLEAFWYIGNILASVGKAALDNLAPLFAVGLGFGLAKDHRGEAALVALFGWFALTNLMNVVPKWFYEKALLSDRPIGGWPEEYFFGNADGTQKYSLLLYIFDFGQKAEVGDTTYFGASYSINMGVFGGILAGVSVAWIYNKYQNVQLPAALGFFSGRRFVPMVTALYFLLGSFVVAAIWPWFQIALLYLGMGLGAIPPLGAFFYGIFNRLLIPTGLHQVLNTYLWFQQPVIGHIMNDPVTGEALWQIIDGAVVWSNEETIIQGDINAFLDKMYANAEFGLAGGSGIFQAGFFTSMMFGLPGAALAMILCVKDKQKRAEVSGILGSAAGVSFLTGVTEPLEFAFMFLAPVLLALHAVLTGVFAAIIVGMGIRLGFGFSAGFIDYALSIKTGWDMSLISAAQNGSAYKFFANPLMLLPVGVVQFAIYFFLFKIVIMKLNLPTPGREEEAAEIAKKLGKTLVGSKKSVKKEDKKLATMGAAVGSTETTTSAPAGITGGRVNLDKHPEDALPLSKIILEAVGIDNLIETDNCITRLRLAVKDNSKVDIDAIKATGVPGVLQTGKGKQLHVIIGPKVEMVAKIFKELAGK
ncbi:PTS transporter subunit EIIC [Spiroplasma endosymbiont of Anurida maritima]|uniref:PTS transporter subunit EIIC n=1 Tax=Spiroplasma endosymbiont of Anurida maritima TaxID=2967972 RepID=UPI0036D2ED2D